MTYQHPTSYALFDPMAEESTGTSLVGVEYADGVVIGADSRTSSGTYISDRVSDKLTQVTDYIFCCRSGSAADTQAITDIVKYHLDFYKQEMGEEPTVFAAANVFRELCYSYRDQFTAGIIVAGWDHKLGSQVYMVPLGGMIVRMKCAIGGSGSTYIYGYRDAHYKPGMNKEEAKQFVINLLSLAMTRDGSSGGVIRTAVIEGNKPFEKEITSGIQIPRFNSSN